jgi:hypothetical protein
MPFTAAAKKALELSLREALAAGERHIGAEHVLLGLLRDEKVDALLGGAAVVLRDELRPGLSPAGSRRARGA